MIRNLLKLDEVISDFTIDDFLFNPCGYSLNGICLDRYFTIHVTPQSNNSYVSFETNLFDENKIGKILNHMVNTFKPFTFDLITFNPPVKTVDFEKNYHQICSMEKKLSCGYLVNFKQLSKIDTKTFEPIEIQTIKEDK